MSDFIKLLADLVWGLPLLIFLLVANFILIYHSRFLPLRGFKYAINLVLRKQSEDKQDLEGQLSHFQALSTALAATVGMGNIAGVAIAIYQGGAGAIFWMWVAAIMGMNTKFFECTLAVMYRGRDYKGEIQGGPMYTITNAMPKKYNFLAYFFSFFGLIGTLSLFQINQLTSYLNESFQISPLYSAIIFFILLFYILKGGLLRIAKVTSRLVPLMAMIYIVLCMIILIKNYDLIIPTFVSIFEHAFGFNQIISGAVGYSILHVIQTGIKRATFSNEAGIGTAPMAHSNARTNRPIDEGYVAMLGPFIDTVVICTITGLTILIGKDSIPTQLSLNGVNLTAFVIENELGVFGFYALFIVIVLFAFTTMVGMANYNKKCWDYLFKGRRFLRDNTFITFYCLTIFLAALSQMDLIINLIDISYALMAVPNIVATLYLAKKVKEKI